MESLLRRIDSEITAAGGKRSKSRKRVIELFFRAGTHVTVDELTRSARRANRNVGAATVYRTLKLLARLGYATEHDFGEGVRRYESNLSPHHDHFVCTRCGEVSEFEEPGIETLQEEVARRHGFRATAHRLDIFGCCRRCAPGDPEGESR
ncbi:MAG: Fur family transcriptional regulator [Gemmatimonadota bacterium]